MNPAVVKDWIALDQARSRELRAGTHWSRVFARLLTYSIRVAAAERMGTRLSTARANVLAHEIHHDVVAELPDRELLVAGALSPLQCAVTKSDAYAVHKAAAVAYAQLAEAALLVAVDAAEPSILEPVTTSSVDARRAPSAPVAVWSRCAHAGEMLRLVEAEADVRSARTALRLLDTLTVDDDLANNVIRPATVPCEYHDAVDQLAARAAFWHQAIATWAGAASYLLATQLTAQAAATVL